MLNHVNCQKAMPTGSWPTLSQGPWPWAKVSWPGICHLDTSKAMVKWVKHAQNKGEVLLEMRWNGVECCRYMYCMCGLKGAMTHAQTQSWASTTWCCHWCIFAWNIASWSLSWGTVAQNWLLRAIYNQKHQPDKTGIATHVDHVGVQLTKMIHNGIMEL